MLDRIPYEILDTIIGMAMVDDIYLLFRLLLVCKRLKNGVETYGWEKVKKLDIFAKEIEPPPMFGYTRVFQLPFISLQINGCEAPHFLLKLFNGPDERALQEEVYFGDRRVTNLMRDRPYDGFNIFVRSFVAHASNLEEISLRHHFDRDCLTARGLHHIFTVLREAVEGRDIRKLTILGAAPTDTLPHLVRTVVPGGTYHTNNLHHLDRWTGGDEAPFYISEIIWDAMKGRFHPHPPQQYYARFFRRFPLLRRFVVNASRIVLSPDRSVVEEALKLARVYVLALASALPDVPLEIDFYLEDRHDPAHPQAELMVDKFWRKFHQSQPGSHFEKQGKSILISLLTGTAVRIIYEENLSHFYRSYYLQ
jgi:hypothetical protein